MPATNANWPQYRFVHISSRFFLGVQPGSTVFQAPGDESAERYCALVTEGVLRAVVPNEGAFRVKPLKLIAVGTERVVRDFEKEGISGWNVSCRACNVSMVAFRMGWKCPKCHGVTGWI